MAERGGRWWMMMMDDLQSNTYKVRHSPSTSPSPFESWLIWWTPVLSLIRRNNMIRGSNPSPCSYLSATEVEVSIVSTLVSTPDDLPTTNHAFFSRVMADRRTSTGGLWMIILQPTITGVTSTRMIFVVENASKNRPRLQESQRGREVISFYKLLQSDRITWSVSSSGRWGTGGFLLYYSNLDPRRRCGWSTCRYLSHWPQSRRTTYLPSYRKLTSEFSSSSRSDSERLPSYLNG